ncbi:hypothetical protein GGI07_004336 [Coemansia sp. Benny D115]|nr:hypothetical protein GGI07_004336 [Coemansia sp. Benny D115]
MAARLLSQSKARATSSAALRGVCQHAVALLSSPIRSTAATTSAAPSEYSRKPSMHSAHRHALQRYWHHARLYSTAKAEGEATAIPASPPAGEQNSNVDKVDVLINALEHAPPSISGQALDRIAECRATRNGRYAWAIVKSLCDPLPETDSLQLPLRFKPHLMTRAVCEGLLEAIAMTDTDTSSARIDSRVIVQMYTVSIERKWSLDSDVLQNTAIYLANSCIHSVARAVSIVNEATLSLSPRYLPADTPPIWLSRLSRFEALEIPVDDIRRQANAVLKDEKKAVVGGLLQDNSMSTIADIARTLEERSFKGSSAFYMFTINALCLHGRRSESENLFAVAKQRDHRNLGSEYASMIAMYYRLGALADADALFEEYRLLWEQSWKRIENTSVMPDSVSVQAEKWRLVHEEYVSAPQVIESAELWRIRSRASGPFYRVALQLVQCGHIEKAIEILRDAKYSFFVTLNSLQLGVLVHVLLARGNTDEAYSLYVDYQRAENPLGGLGIVARQVIFGSTPSGHVTNDILRALGEADDWDRIWSITGDAKGCVRGTLYIDSVKWLLTHALKTDCSYQAIKCARLINNIAAKNSTVLERVPETWVEMVLEQAASKCESMGPEKQSLVTALAIQLLHKDTKTQSRLYSRWNSWCIRSVFKVADRLQDAALVERVRKAIYAFVYNSGMIELVQVCNVLKAEALRLYDTLPEEITNVPTSFARVEDGGWGLSPIDVSIADKDSKFWECTVLAFRHLGTCEVRLTNSAAHGLLVTLKLAFFLGVKLNPALLESVDNVLLSSGCPIVDPQTGDLFPHAKQVSAGKMYQVNSKWTRKISDAPATNDRKGAGTNAGTNEGSRKTFSGKISTAASATVLFDTPFDDKVQWYNSCRAAGEIPALQQLSWLIVQAMQLKKRDIWEPIVQKHTPEYLIALDNPEATARAAISGEASMRTLYATTIWSHAVFAYSDLGEIEEAADYFCRIVRAGGYPISQATAALLAALTSSDGPLPVLPRGWDGPATPVFGLEAVYPPRGSLPQDVVLAPSSAAERRQMVGQIGLAMLYAALRHRIYPTVHYYSVLLAALGHAHMVAELRQIFEVVMPQSMRKMPAALRINPAFMPSPIIWAVAIREAMKNNERVLAEYWFKEYRMSAMPIFREEASAYSRFAFRNQPKYARLFLLSRPYYVIAQIRRPVSTENELDVLLPWYDLKEVEKQLQLDRLRVLDNLPLSYMDAAKMLSIYATVDEHRNMDSAEIMAEEINSLYLDKAVPKYSKPRGYEDLAMCWKMMVSGYQGLLRYQQHQVECKKSDIVKTKERLDYWYKRWESAVQKTSVNPEIPSHRRMALSGQDIKLLDSILKNV